MRPLLLMQAYIGANAARFKDRSARHAGGMPMARDRTPKASVGLSSPRFRGEGDRRRRWRGLLRRARPLRQSFGLPPPPENRGRKEEGRPIAGPPLPFSPLRKTDPRFHGDESAGR